MRHWVRERMRRRGKRAKNESESTGKVGQEKPEVTAGQPAPLQPSYYLEETEPGRPGQPEASPSHRHREDATANRMQVVTQPESPYLPPAPADEVLKQPTTPSTGSAQQLASQEKRAPRGVVVLAIGLPGSGKTTW